MTALTASIHLPDRHVAVEFSCAPTTMTALIGPNGAGKSSIINAIAGLVTPASGHITIDGTPVFSRVTQRRIDVPPHRRSASVLAQRPMLFPHMTVLENVAFPARSAGLSRRLATAEATHWLTVVGAMQWASRRPARLSGGQAQRVALARALAAKPQILLLDEPLAALDVTASRELRKTLRTVVRAQDLTCIVVTHEPADIVALADRVLVVNSGKIVEDAETERFFAAATSDFGRTLTGVNVVNAGPLSHRSATLAPAQLRVRLAACPADSRIASSPATLDEIGMAGPVVLAHCTLADGTKLTAVADQFTAALQARVGGTVWLTISEEPTTNELA